MADGDHQRLERAAAFLKAADLLETWIEDLPKWRDDGQEPWYRFLDRRYEAEMALIERLRCTAKGEIENCPLRLHVILTLGGISVRTDQGLAAALREWAERARQRYALSDPAGQERCQAG